MAFIDLFRGVHNPETGGFLGVYSILSEKVLVDDIYFDELNKYRWFLNATGYAYRGEKSYSHNNSSIIFLHSEVLRLSGQSRPGPAQRGKGSPLYQCDHINGVKLDNQLSNLRWATRTQQQLNRVFPPGKLGLPQGVNYGRTHGKKRTDIFVARLNVNGVRKYLGQYNTIEEASQAYKDALVKYYPGEILCRG